MVDDTLTVYREVVNTEVRNEEFGRVDYTYEAENDDGDIVCVFDHLTLVERNRE